jgi:hypothetical protein
MDNFDSPSLDFIAGAITTGSAFMWVKQKQIEVPVFQIKMPFSELPLLELIKNKLGLKEKIYKYTYKKNNYLLLLVRSRSSLEKTVIPTFDGRLFGTKKIQFENWKNKYFEKKLNFIYKRNERMK